MDTPDDLIEYVENWLERGNRSARDAGSIANNIVELERKHPSHEPLHVRLLKAKFLSGLPRWDIVDPINHEADMMIIMVETPGDLIGEEIFLLFCVCDGVYALESLGLDFDADLKARFEAGVRQCFSRQPEDAKSVAKHLADEWKMDYWWYKENLM